jgi:D-beta-D-heptose 7-phosphate kinase/D-beta-D-heptose 1-phosphate adenosyltransferase
MTRAVGHLRTAVVQGFTGRRALVVGDLMLDRYLVGEVARISPEAPVPIVRLERQRTTVGGAGNVAANLAGLGLHVTVAGWTGDDADRASLLAPLALAGVDTSPVVAVPGRATTTKTRVLASRQQLVRVDHEETGPVADDVRSRFDDHVLGLLDQRYDVVVLSDYAKGVLSETLCRDLIARVRETETPVLVDPKSRDFAKYAGASAITPNSAELASAAHVDADDLPALLGSAARLRQELSLGALVVTRGQHGITIVDTSGTHHVEARAREVFDVSGAGDTAVAALAASVAAGLDWLDAAAVANLAAGIAVAHTGTVAVSLTDLLEAIAVDEPGRGALEAKVCDLDTVLARVERWRASGATIGFTNGCFDLLHAGHVSYLDWARSHCDHLVVGLNTDSSVRAQKGPGRPVVAERERATVLAGLAAVDAVVLFAEPTPLRLVDAIRPDVLVKGADYSEGDIVGAAEVRGWGGTVLLAPLVEGWSTSALLERAGEEC